MFQIKLISPCPSLGRTSVPFGAHLIMAESACSPTDGDDGVECKHGPQECLGNILELCAASVYPDPKIYLGFTMCLTGRYEEIPQRELVVDCALEHGMDFDKLNDCVSRDDGSYGIDLLKGSVERTADAGVTKSCTVRLKNKIRTVRDGGKWKDYEGGHDPDELISDIKRVYQASDEDWVPRRVPQPANVKASKSKTAKVHKPTNAHTLMGTRLKEDDTASSLAHTEPALPDDIEAVKADKPVASFTPLESTATLEALTITTPYSSSTLSTSSVDELTITTPSTDQTSSQTSGSVTIISTESTTTSQAL